MSKTEVGTENIYFEMESKRETEAGTYDEVHIAEDSKSPATSGPATKRMSFETFSQGEEKTRQPLTEADTAISRRMLFVTAAVVAVTFLIAVATLVLALTMMKSRDDSTTFKGETDMYGK